MSLSRHQLQRADLITQIEQGRRVEQEQFQENHRGLQTMGELLKARVFGATEWAINLRKRMTTYAPMPAYPRQTNCLSNNYTESMTLPTPEPHNFPCEDPYCDPCAEAIKRIFRDLNLLPSGNPVQTSYTPDAHDHWHSVAPRYRKDESDV